MFFILLLTFLSVYHGHPVHDSAWQTYKEEFNKIYSNVEEEATRYQIWVNNVNQIELHNADYASTYTQGVNQFSDMSDEEFKEEMLSSLEVPEGNWTSDWAPPPRSVELPHVVDWVAKGYVTPIKYQGHCGSCYSFSATGALEGAWFKKTGKLVSLSEQQIVDCSRSHGNRGCGGGWYQKAWEYLRSCGGSQTEETYPYESREWICRLDRKKIGATVSSYHNLESKDEGALKEAVATIGPVSVAIDASCRGFRSYRNGVYSNHGCGSKRGDLNHAVLAVGYGSEEGKDYWLVKNSWGTRFGIHGYIKIARNAGNMCGIAWTPSFPIV